MRYQFLFLTLYFVVLTVFLLGINLYYLDGMPHVPDSAAYLFMAKMFASGHIIEKIPVPAEFVDYFPGILSVQNGTWLFQYPFGHPLLLTLGVLLHFPNIIPPLVGSSFILFLYLTAKTAYNRTVGIFALFLPLFSPFFIENAASYMSHNTASLYVMIALFCIISYYKNHKPLSMLFSGICIGLLFNTRPLTAVPFFLMISILVLKKDLVKKHFRASIYFFGSVAFFLFLFTLYNKLTTGGFSTSQYYAQNSWLFGVGQSTTISDFFIQRFNNLRILFFNFTVMIYNLPPFMMCMFFGFFVFLLFIKNKIMWDRVFFLGLFTLPFCYFFYNGTFLMYGPRFWYEIIPFVFLLTARIFALLFKKQKILAVTVFLLMGVISLGKFFSFLPSQSPDFFSPTTAKELVGFNFTDRRIDKKLKQLQITNAVIFVQDCSGNWWCYGSVFWENNPTLSTDIVYLKDLGEKNRIVFSRYKNKKFYRVNYDTGNIKQL